MKSKIKEVKVIYHDDTEEFKRRVAEVIARIIIERIGEDGVEVLVEKLKEQNKN